jgi:hypothetical protein
MKRKDKGLLEYADELSDEVPTLIHEIAKLIKYGIAYVLAYIILPFFFLYVIVLGIWKMITGRVKK